MSAGELDVAYWEKRWSDRQTGWDIGYPSTPIKTYFDQVEDHSKRILIPGCGNAWEGEYLHRSGFENLHLIDIAPTAVRQIQQRIPLLPKDNVILGDFFALEGTYDYIVEQTFFCALEPARRMEYAAKVHELLAPGGRLVGVLFDTDFGNDHPPFGGTKAEYLNYFEGLFDIHAMDRAHNSINPRQGKELFINLLRP
ncbi:MAG: methyltransferase domain-containing protein [Flavobacteriales bacterium]|nr:methyltransferase domain-containing protein [Flavobacteriales bacterium]